MKTQSVRTTLATAMGAFNRPYALVHKTSGEELAGGGTREIGEAWGAVGTNKDDTTSGQWYKSESEARQHFNRVTCPIIEWVVVS